MSRRPPKPNLVKTIHKCVNACGIYISEKHCHKEGQYCFLSCLQICFIELDAREPHNVISYFDDIKLRRTWAHREILVFLSYILIQIV